VLVLAVDTATSAVIAGLARLPVAGEPELLAERVTLTARAHGELLMPSVCEVMTRGGVSMRELDAVVCGAGPGPFTGLRVGMVTAAALADGLNIPAYPVCSLDAMAYRAGAGSPLLVVTDARRRELYWARYSAAGMRIDGPHVGRPEDVPLDGVSRAVGACDALQLPVSPPRHPDPAALVAVAAPALRSPAPPLPLTPLYLRRPDAVPPGPAKRVTPA
jgi:tRNA threonylcarbamoyl adenosine modification protein YeaZ